MVCKSSWGNFDHSILFNSLPIASIQCLCKVQLGCKLPCSSITSQVSTGPALNVTSWSKGAILYQHKLQHIIAIKVTICDRKWYRYHVLYQEATGPTIYFPLSHIINLILTTLWKRTFNIRVLVRLLIFMEDTCWPTT